MTQSLRTLALLAGTLACTTVHADEQRTSAMLWGSALDGSVQIGPATAEFDLSVEEILNVLDGSIALRHESRGETRGWYAEFFIADLKKETSGALGEKQMNMKETIVELGLSTPFAAGWEVYGGARWQTVDNSIEFAVLPTTRATTDWADAVLGVRWARESEGSRYWARGDVAGGGSEGAYLFEAGGAWRFAEDWEFTVAWRMLDTQLGDGAFLLDLTQVGAVIGVSRNW